MSQCTRRQFVRLGLSVPLAALSMDLGRSALADLGKSLRVATWGGSWKDSLEANVGKALADKGVKIEYILGNPPDNLARLIAAQRQGQVPFDVMEGFPHLTREMAQAGLIQALPYDRMPNAKAAPQYARHEHEIVSLFTQDGVIYNTQKFTEAGIAPPKAYGDLADPKLAGKVAFPDISNAQHWNAVVGMAYESGGNEADLSGAVAMLGKIKPAYYFSASTELANRCGSGDIWAAAWHAGWAVRLRRSNVPLGVAYTRFGDKKGALWSVPAYIIAKTPNQGTAEAFIDSLMSPEVQFTHGKQTGSVPVDSSARKRLAEDPLSAELLMLGDREMEQAYQIDWSRLNVDAWRETWSRQVKR